MAQYDSSEYAMLARYHLTEDDKIFLSTKFNRNYMSLDSLVDIPFKHMQSKFPYTNKFTIYTKLYGILPSMNKAI